MRNNLKLLTVSLLVAFVIAEIICRIKGNYLSYNERTGASGYTSPFICDELNFTHSYQPHQSILLKRNEFTDSWRANEDGLKEKNIADKKNKHRILLLGDSFTEGVGAPPDSSYPRILETLLDTNVEVINAGLGGSDIFFEYKLLQKLNARYKPDAVIVTCNPSDVLEYLTRGGFERFARNNQVSYRSAPWFEPLYAHSLLVRLIVHDVFHYDFSFIKQQDYDGELSKATAAMCCAIDSFRIFCSENRLQFGMVFHPFYPDIMSPGNYTMKALIAHSSEENIPYTDALNCLQHQGINAQNWKTIYWQNDGHFKPKGYELLAKCVFEFIEKQKWSLFDVPKSLNNKAEDHAPQ